jgi:hypothetical protein
MRPIRRFACGSASAYDDFIVLAGLAALLFILVQAPRFLAFAATQPEKITVTLPVVVTDRLDRYVSGLEKEHFKLYEDRTEQEIGGFDNNGNADVSLVIFVNGIAHPTTERVLNALMAAGRPNDEFEVVGPNAATELKDGLRTAIERSRSLRNARRAIVVVSVGSEAPVFSPEETQAIAATANVPIYALSTAENTAIKPLLDDFARLTGGRHSVINTSSDLDQPVKKVEVGIRNSYLLTYDSTNLARNGGYRQIRVKVVPPLGITALNVSGREGYFAPRP